MFSNELLQNTIQSENEYKLRWLRKVPKSLSHLQNNTPLGGCNLGTKQVNCLILHVISAFRFA